MKNKKTNPFQQLASRKPLPPQLKSNLIENIRFNSGLLLIIDLFVDKSVATVISCFNPTHSVAPNSKDHNGRLQD